MPDHDHGEIRLWVSEHNNGWEAWVAQLEDGTYTSWTCPATEDPVAMYIEDSFAMACAAAHFDLIRLSGHDTCGPGCSLWEER